MIKPTIALFAVLFSVSTSTFAAEADPAAKIRACDTPRGACIAKGYTYGAHNNGKKGLWIDCIQPIAAGKTVVGVTGLTQSAAAACLKAKTDAGLK